MPQPTRYLTLIDYVPLFVTMETAPSGNLWQVVAVDRREGTGYETCQVAVVDGKNTDILNFHGASVVGLGDRQLEVEAERLRRIKEAADQALSAIEQHLAFRRGL